MNRTTCIVDWLFACLAFVLLCVLPCFSIIEGFRILAVADEIDDFVCGGVLVTCGPIPLWGFITMSRQFFHELKELREERRVLDR